MTEAEKRDAIFQLYADYGLYIDQDRLEEWLDFFTDDCVYQILPRENVDRGLPLSLMLCDSKNMLQDRIVSLRKANIFNIHTDRHIIGSIRIRSVDGDFYHTEASYAVFQTDQEGRTRVFSVGAYRDRIIFGESGPQFAEKTVITDTGAIQSLLSTPL